MDQEEVDLTISILPDTTKELMARNYFKSKINPDPGRYYISVQGAQIIERLVELKDPIVLQAKAANRS
jgi:hypothetical protein